MSFWPTLRTPAENELIVGFYDLTGYMRFAEAAEPLSLLELIQGYFQLTGRIIAQAGGKLLKPIGDAGMFAFPPDLADQAVAGMNQLRSEGDAWVRARGFPGHARIAMHAGPVAVGKIGAPGDERLDIIGKVVNIAAVLQTSGLTLTPAVFRLLSPQARTAFRKHTPPISYIAMDDVRPRW
jgi:class 3 adenylate cyclase